MSAWVYPDHPGFCPAEAHGLGPVEVSRDDRLYVRRCRIIHCSCSDQLSAGNYPPPPSMRLRAPLPATWPLILRSGRLSTGFNSLAQPPKGRGDGVLGVILPYPFLQRRRKWQRLAGFKPEGTNEAEGRLRHVGGLYLKRGVAHTRVKPGETHGAIVDPEIYERAFVERHAQRHVPRRLGKDLEIPQFLWQPFDGVVGIRNEHRAISARIQTTGECHPGRKVAVARRHVREPPKRDPDHSPRAGMSLGPCVGYSEFFRRGT